MKESFRLSPGIPNPLASQLIGRALNIKTAAVKNQFSLNVIFEIVA